LKTYYKNDLKRAYMILEGEEGDREDYQIVMLKENQIPGILDMDVRYVDNLNQYYYDISGKTSFKILHEKVNLTFEEMKGLVNQLLQAIHILKKYMLDSKCLLLDPEFIFCADDSYYFCYYPFSRQDICEEFHRLTEFFVREVNYKDEEGVHFAYTLHKATMEENYSIEEIMKSMLPKPEDEEDICEVPVVDYTERIESLTKEESMIEEKDSMWESVRKFLERSKRRKRGYGSEDL